MASHQLWDGLVWTGMIGGEDNLAACVESVCVCVIELAFAVFVLVYVGVCFWRVRVIVVGWCFELEPSLRPRSVFWSLNWLWLESRVEGEKRVKRNW
ncbi:hypothetical protein M758_3G130300 [Ceratodon purpureus]|nr:hypothetical protein M758_3G130300 [Ceratodon purpureus]